MVLATQAGLDQGWHSYEFFNVELLGWFLKLILCKESEFKEEKMIWFCIFIEV